jgi:hypothetical protein
MNYKYYKGNFTGLSAKKDSVLSLGKHNFYDFKWSYIQIKNIQEIEAYDVEKEKIGDYYYSNVIKPKKYILLPFYWQSIHSRLFEIKTKKDSFWIEYVSVFLPKLIRRPEVFISVNEDNYFNEDLHDVLLRDIKLKEESNAYVKKEFIELNGTIHFKIEIPEIKKPTSTEIENNNGMNRSENVDLSDEKDTTTKIESVKGDSITGETINRPITEPIEKPGPTLPSFSGKWLGILFGAFLWILLLGFFWLFFPNYFIFALIAFIGWFISRFIANTNLKSIFNLLFIGAFLIFLGTIFINKDSFIDPTVDKKDGSVKINPPKAIKKEGVSEEDIDYEISKDISWFDFIKNKFELKYNTSVQSFFETQSEHVAADADFLKTSKDPLTYYSKLFNKLELLDEPKIDSIVRLLGNKAASKKLNQLQTAEMVTTFIQEIPYVLVHQNSCQQIIESAPRNSFVVTYHNENKPCLANIPGGIQSPYEFLHNLKGDCDTRSLLGYSILKKFNIAASVWVSQTYGHSILGIGLPIGNGVYKSINGVKHYPIELTSKGFRLGMIAPQHKDMSNWDIALYSNNY